MPPEPKPSSFKPDATAAISVEAGVNMLLARLSFDILRSPAVKVLLKSRIHRKLNELRVPGYIHGFEVRLFSCFLQPVYFAI